MRLTLLLVALGSSSVALTAQAQKDLAGCKPVLDAMLKTLTTPHHAYSTQMRGGNPQVSESIVANGKSYFQHQGKWRLSPMTVADMVKQEQENIDSATAYTCKATAGGGYHVHSENSIGKYDGDVWVQNGLVTHIEQDMDTGDPNKMHVSTKYDYSNVTAPPGV